MYVNSRAAFVMKKNHFLYLFLKVNISIHHLGINDKIKPHFVILYIPTHFLMKCSYLFIISFYTEAQMRSLSPILYGLSNREACVFELKNGDTISQKTNT